MAALWGGGAGHSGAGGTLPVLGTSEPLYSLAENLHLASLETETIHEAGQFLETMQDYLDSSVISIIEDFSSLTETKSHMDAENELSLLSAITDILDSTDDESLSPFDPIPESELLTSPGEHENSLRFRKLSVTPPEHITEDFQQPRPCTIMTEKVQASTTSHPFRLTSGYPKESVSSNKASSKEFWREQKLFKHRGRELAMLQRSDGEEEEEEEEEAGCKQSSVAGVKEIPVTLAAKESEKDLDECNDPYVIAPENISLSELVRSVHSYCQPTLTVCMSPESQPLAEEIFTGPVVLEIVPDGEESMEIPVVLHNMEIELPCGMDINSATNEAAVLVPTLGKEFPEYKDSSADLDKELDSYRQDERIVRATLQNIKDDQIQIDEETQKSTDDQKNRSEPALAAKNTKLIASKKGQISSGIKKKKKFCQETKCQKTITCRKVSACARKQARVNRSKFISDFGFQKKKREKVGGKDHRELPLDQVSEAKETPDDQLESSKCVKKLGPKNSLVLNSESTYTLSGAEEPQSQRVGISHVTPTVQGNVQGEPHENSQSILPVEQVSNSEARLEASHLLPSCTVDFVGQPSKNTSCFENQEATCSPKETKPRPLSLTEYRQRRQQRLSNDDRIQNTTKNQSASKWPSVPKPPKGLADLPCLIAPLPSTRAAASKLVKEPEKSASSSTALAPADKSSARPLPVLSSTTTTVQREPPPLQLGCVNVGPSSTPISLPPPREVCTFSQVGTQVPPTLSVPHVPHVSPAPEALLQASFNPYNLGSSQPPWSSWSPFTPLPANFQRLPPPSLANEAHPPVFHTLPPLPPPSWLPPPVPLPFVAGLPYGSAEWAPQPQSSYWSAVPPPTLPISYGDQGGLMQSSPVGILPTPSLSDGPFGQQTAAFTLDPTHIKVQNTSVNEKQSLPVQVSQMEAPAVVKAATRRVSDPRRQAQSSAVPFKTEVITSSSQPLEKLPLSLVEPSGQTAVIQHVKKSSVLQSMDEPQQMGQLTKSFEKESTFQFVEENLAHSGSVEKPSITTAQSNKPPEQEHSSSSTSLTAGKQKGPTGMESEVTKLAPTVASSPASSLSQKVQETGHFKKKPSFAWKCQPFVSSAQPGHNKDIVQAFISEIGIEASDLSSLLEQFEKTEAINEASAVTESRRNVSAGSSGSEAQLEKKMVDQLHAPELINVAGLTPPATPPHHLWKPLAAVSLLGKDGTQKDARLLKSLSKPHRKSLVPVHVGSGEHDYCQLSVAQPKGGARWNVKKHLDITIKPIKTITKQIPDQLVLNQSLATARLNPIASACHNSKETSNHVDSNKDQTKDSRPVRPGLKPTTTDSVLLKSSLVYPHKEALDHRTTNAGSMIRSTNDPCSVLLSPAASPCWDSGEPTLQQPEEVQKKPLASRYSLRCYRGRQRSASLKRGRLRSQRNHASQSFSSSSDGDSDTSLSSSSSSSRSRSRSPPSKRWRRSHSRSSSSSCEWSRSRGRSRSSSSSSFLSRSPTRSPSLHRRNSCEKRYNSSSSFERYQRQKIRHKERAIEERRVVFIGKIHSRMTRSELRHRFSVFGDIEDCTLHFREHGDNYGFVTYRYAEEAFAAIKGGHALLRPDEQPFDLCFGGRRQFCERNYVDLDSNLDDFEPACMKNKSDTLDFGTLLKQAQQRHRR